DQNYKSSAHPGAPLCSSDTDSWEPPDSMKGEIARAMFYMDVRYSGDRSLEPNLILTDALTQIDSSTNLMGRLGTLLAWHHADPVDQSEQTRNDLIFQRYQHNRNPFVDHPEWADQVFSPRPVVSRQTNTLTISWDAIWPDARVQVLQLY